MERKKNESKLFITSSSKAKLITSFTRFWARSLSHSFDLIYSASAGSRFLFLSSCVVMFFFLHLHLRRKISKQNDWAFRRKFQKTSAAFGSNEGDRSSTSSNKLGTKEANRNAKTLFCIANAAVLSLFGDRASSERTVRQSVR